MILHGLVIMHSVISSSLFPLLNDGLRDGLQIVGLSHLGPEIDHAGCQVEEVRDLCCLVVHGEGVVVVVPSLTAGTETHEDVLARVDGLIVGSLSPEMSCAVDQPGGVESPAVPHEGADEERVVEGFTPEVHGYGGRDEETDQEDQLQVMSSLELKDRVI